LVGWFCVGLYITGNLCYTDTTQGIKRERKTEKKNIAHIVFVLFFVFFFEETWVHQLRVERTRSKTPARFIMLFIYVYILKLLREGELSFQRESNATVSVSTQPMRKVKREGKKEKRGRQSGCGKKVTNSRCVIVIIREKRVGVGGVYRLFRFSSEKCFK
jgi:hypothetical protein